MDTANQSPATEKFLLEEYRNIASTHDKLRDQLARVFNYFLLLTAFPFTVAGIMFRQGGFDLSAASSGLHVLFFFVGLGHLVLAMTLVDARLAQYRYARTVNAVRRYFADHDPDVVPYLCLPTSSSVPSWRELGYIQYQVILMAATGAASCAYGAWAPGLFEANAWTPAIVSSLVAILYVVAYWLLRRHVVTRYGTDLGIK